MKKLVVVIVAVLFAVGSAGADTARPENRIRLTPQVQVVIDDASLDSAAGGVTRVRGVFRVFGDDDDADIGPRPAPARRKSRRSTKSRRSSEPQKTRTVRPVQPQPDGILVLLECPAQAM